MTDLSMMAQHDACDRAYEEYQKAVKEFQAVPSSHNRAIALGKGRIWETLFLALPPAPPNGLSLSRLIAGRV